MFIANAFAQTAAAPGGSDALMQLLPFVFIFVIMYVLIIRPQQKRMKELKTMIENIRRGDTVVTSGGLIGKVAKVEDNEIQVDLAENTRVRIVKSMVVEVRAKGEPVTESK